jgi:hypothetical protein
MYPILIKPMPSLQLTISKHLFSYLKEEAVRCGQGVNETALKLIINHAGVEKRYLLSFCLDKAKIFNIDYTEIAVMELTNALTVIQFKPARL